MNDKRTTIITRLLRNDGYEKLMNQTLGLVALIIANVPSDTKNFNQCDWNKLRSRGPSVPYVHKTVRTFHPKSAWFNKGYT
jgi:hypothetical protein